MKVCSFQKNGIASYGIAEGDEVIAVGDVVRNQHPDLKSFMAAEGVMELSRYTEMSPRIPMAELEIQATIPNPNKVLCIGFNYRSHIKETGRDAPNHPPLFLRVANSLTGHNQPLIRPRVSDEFDFEGELAVIIGKSVRHASVADALDCVAGYTVCNEGSVREWQRHTTQFSSGKTFYKSGSVGPHLVTTDEIPDPSVLKLTTRLNGEVMQEVGVDDLLFDVPNLIQYLSTITELEPGDIIATGTPGGVGNFRDPKVFMKPGDTVEVEIDQIGTLINSIADET